MTSNTMQAAQQSEKNGIQFNQKLLWRIVSVIVTLGLLIFLVNQIEWADFREMLGRVSLLSLLGAAAAYLALNYFRGLRFRALLERPETPMRILFPITLYHNFLVRVLPFKLGELSYIVMLKAQLNYPVEEGFSSLFGARLMELLLIVTVFSTSLLSAGDLFTEQRPLLLLIITVTFITCIVALYFAGTLTRAAMRIMRALTRMLFSTTPGLIEVLLNKLGETAEKLDHLRNPRLFGAALFFTLFTYSFAFLPNFILLRAVGVDATLATMATIISIGMFASAIPFSISGFGTVEFGWALALTQVAGYNLTEATSIAFLLHGFQIFASSFYGLLGFLTMRRKMKRKPGSQDAPTLHEDSEKQPELRT